MVMSMLERHHLTIIREVSRRGTLTGAAEALHLTQPALSHAIKKLEQQLNTPIWTKEGRHLRLTPAGDYLLWLANRLLPQFDHAEQVIEQIAKGQRGILRIGMECHPCYQWLLKIVEPYLQQWPDVDVDVKQAFQFGGIGALFGYEIDVLVTPDPLYKKGLCFEPVFDYEQVLVVGTQHALATAAYVEPGDLAEQTLITYPVEAERLDIFTQFLLPANCSPKKHKIIETTDMMLQMVAAGRGVAALPGWLVGEYAQKLAIKPVRLGKQGIAKKIFLGIRKTDAATDYIASFVTLAQKLR
jgi:LysR family transcriptional regulator, regulator for metE and metH